jgi:capsular exopolysaccharide synthesis family protein
MTVTSAGQDESAAALGPYVRAIRSRALVVALTTIAAVGVAAALLATREPLFKSTAQLLVTPLPQDDRTFLGTGLLRDSGDPTRTVQTAAALVASPLAAQRTARRLGHGLTERQVEGDVDVQPLGDSSILSVTASSTTADAATRLANEYAQSALAVRGEQIRRQIDAAIGAVGPNPTQADNVRLAELRAVRERGDPTLTLSQPAVTPRSAGGAPAWLVLVLAAMAGFTLGSIAALLIERVDRRVRDESELLALAPMPILLRVPAMGRTGRGASADAIAGSVREVFRTLQIQLDQRRAEAGGRGQTVMITSASSGDGKTSTALNLSFALIGAGHRVILMDCDLRNPDIARQLELETSEGLVALLTSRVRLSALLQSARTPALRVLAAASGSRDNTLLHGLDHRIGEILEEAAELADYVIIDTAPLGEVGDPLTIAAHVNDLLLVGRPQHTNRQALKTAIGLLERAHTSPTGWVIVGEEGTRLSSLYLHAGSNGVGWRRGSRSRRRSPAR